MMKFFIKIFFLTLLLTSFSLPEKIQKKVNKEVIDVFEIDSFELKEIVISEELNNALPLKINGDKFFEVVIGNQKLGYVFVDEAPSKTATFDYLVIFDENLVIKRSKVLI